ncbi:hypothetical protein EMIHUDRAFT_229262 [Emiliania huxleyi CCMP1516]|uniref:Uncharacterized protein n=2 Tax=Emiliania huxleyi TaxID=2903 RepID=A0A0D3KDC8_EMIH1|nr:hypothetical protein EMIHUDRAFT_229262 [Emiliania huxleyi CCMP1516]EOD33763.1 hypothetical protein EMIHUDRAFT_229262 [Emiliania huxleyi CCMP1516]|eukprot:XP_005786192.1 hypothetical protein EMIHUDRAFT_229262 [Emiliania huxleyi CCMP1516]
MAASRPTIAPDEDIAALLERAQVSVPISDKVVPQLLAQDVGSVAALLEQRDGRRRCGACDAQATEGGIGGGTEVSSLDPSVPALPTSGDGTIDAAREEEEWAAAAVAYRQVCPVRREVAAFEEYRRQAAAEGRAAAEAAAEAEMEEEEPETGSGEAAALAAPLRGLASAPGCAGTTDRVTSFFDTLRPACNATTASSSSSAAFIHAYRPPDPLSVGPCGVICARGYATIWPANYDERCLLDGAAIRLLASAMATVRAYEDIEARRGRDGGDVRDVRSCRDVRSWAEVCAAAREREFKILARDSASAAEPAFPSYVQHVPPPPIRVAVVLDLVHDPSVPVLLPRHDGRRSSTWTALAVSTASSSGGSSASPAAASRARSSRIRSWKPKKTLRAVRPSQPAAGSHGSLFHSTSLNFRTVSILSLRARGQLWRRSKFAQVR